MKTSPWAKLMRRTIPYTIVYPSAIRAYTKPSCRPFSACWRKYSTAPPYGFTIFTNFCAPLDLHDRRALDAVAFRSSVDFPVTPWKSLIEARASRIFLGRRSPPSGSPRGADSCRHTPAFRGHRNLSVLLPVLLHPCHDLRPQVVRGVVVGEVAALDRAPAIFIRSGESQPSGPTS